MARKGVLDARSVHQECRLPDVDRAFCSGVSRAQQVIPVWPGVAPGSEDWTQKEETTGLPPLAAGSSLVRNVTRPTLTVFLPNPSIANGGHGFGMNKQSLPTDHWIERFDDWLGEVGLLGPKK